MYSRVFFVKIVLLALSGVIGLPIQAQNGFVFSEKAQYAELPFEYINHFVLVRLRLNHTLPVTFLFDTGAESTVLTRRELSDFLNVQYSRRLRLQGSDLSDTLVAHLARNIRLDAGESLVSANQDVLVLEEDYFRFDTYTGVPVYGILSANTMSDYLVEIDYARLRIRLHRPGHYDPARHGYTAVPMTVERNKPYVQARISVVPDSTVTVKLLLDTGAALPLLLFYNTHPLLAPPAQTVPSRIAMGIGGYLEGYTGRITRLSVGPFEQQAVITYFQQIDTSFWREHLNDRNGLIGNLVFRHFHVIFDYQGKTLWLKPSRSYDEPYRFDRSGLYLVAIGDADNGQWVQFVVPGSPGAEAGIVRGDVLLKAGNRKATSENLTAINRLFQQKPGKRVPLLLRRNGEELKKEIVLRDLL